MDVRLATAADVPSMIALVNEAFVPERAFVEGDRTNPSQISTMMSAGSFYLAEEAGRFVGCVYVKVNGARGYFGMLSVDPKLQGAGHGRKLVEIAEDHCRRAGCNLIEITVLHLRNELPPFYRHLGYTETGTKPFPEPARMKTACHFIVMTKPLTDPALLEKAREIHRTAIVIDLHADTPQRLLDEHIDWGQRLPNGHLDIPRMKEGGLSAQFFAIWVERKYAPHNLKRALALIDAVYAAVEKYPDDIAIATSAADIRCLHGSGKIAALLAVEGGHAIEDDLRVLNIFWRLGVRYMTLTWANSNNWADASTEPPVHNGLTDFGKQVVRRMNDLGMMVDVSHVSDKTFYDVLEVSRVPVIASHSCAKKFADVPRNMTDDMIRALASNGGVMHINFHEGFLDQKHIDARRPLKPEFDKLEAEAAEKYKNDPAALARENRRLQAAFETRVPRPSLTVVADHIDHVKNLVGADHVGIGSDFDGARMPVGLEGANLLPHLTAELLRRGYTEAELAKILGGNTLRVMEAVEKGSATSTAAGSGWSSPSRPPRRRARSGRPSPETH
jgi:membrane dipeptidase